MSLYVILDDHDVVFLGQMEPPTSDDDGFVVDELTLDEQPSHGLTEALELSHSTGYTLVFWHEAEEGRSLR